MKAGKHVCRKKDSIFHSFHIQRIFTVFSGDLY